jgi:gliding motility-associated-like protein
LTVSPAVTTSYLWHGISETFAVTVFVTAPPSVQLGPDTTICEGTSILLDAGNPGSTYAWSNGATAQQVTVSDSGTYVVTVDNGSCKARDTFNLTVIPAPGPDLQGPFSICPDNEETVLLDAGPGLAYNWNPVGDTTRTLLVTEPGVYGVVVTYSGGCTRTGTAEVTELCRETLFIPGAFTPNNDGKNDVFFAEGANLLSYEIVIFNRWGQQVFATKIIGRPGAWDGKQNGSEATSGLYAYRVRFEAIRENGKKETEVRTGTLVLVR